MSNNTHSFCGMTLLIHAFNSLLLKNRESSDTDKYSSYYDWHMFLQMYSVSNAIKMINLPRIVCVIAKLEQNTQKRELCAECLNVLYSSHCRFIATDISKWDMPTNGFMNGRVIFRPMNKIYVHYYYTTLQISSFDNEHEGKSVVIY